jgi:hypothetical protein|tara:strand:- start:2474 stop:2746 length:273 start_codon:yes stop_codon:yes gene_type:complete
MSTRPIYTEKLLSYQGQNPKFEYGDCRIGKELKSEVQTPSAWVVGQWLLARKQGRVLSEIANRYCDQAIAGTQNKALQWLISTPMVENHE